MFKFIRLTPEYASQVDKLEKKIYPERFRLGRETIEANLKIFEEDGTNFSVGLLHDKDLVGYLIAWPNETRAEGYDEVVVYVDDMAILPEYKDRFFGILAAFVEQISEKKYGHLAIEGIARRKAYNLLKKHRRVLEELGYELKDTHEYFNEKLFEDMVWVRILPIF